MEQINKAHVCKPDCFSFVEKTERRSPVSGSTSPVYIRFTLPCLDVAMVCDCVGECVGVDSVGKMGPPDIWETGKIEMI